MSMPDTWEYPWYAAWDLAFHCIPFALVDPHFAKSQARYHSARMVSAPERPAPAYEWNFRDVNPPVIRWAAWRVYKIEQRATGKADRAFLETCFHKCSSTSPGGSTARTPAAATFSKAVLSRPG
jgi:hypothetical protein